MWLVLVAEAHHQGQEHRSALSSVSRDRVPDRDDLT